MKSCKLWTLKQKVKELLTIIAPARSIHQYKVLARIAAIRKIVLLITSKKWSWAYAFTISLVKLWQYIMRNNFTKVTETIIPTTQCHLSPSEDKSSSYGNLEIELTKEIPCMQIGKIVCLSTCNTQNYDHKVHDREINSMIWSMEKQIYG